MKYEIFEILSFLKYCIVLNSVTDAEKFLLLVYYISLKQAICIAPKFWMKLTIACAANKCDC